MSSPGGGSKSRICAGGCPGERGGTADGQREDSGRRPAQTHLPWASRPADSADSAAEQKAAPREVRGQGCPPSVLTPPRGCEPPDLSALTGSAGLGLLRTRLPRSAVLRGRGVRGRRPWRRHLRDSRLQARPTRGQQGGGATVWSPSSELTDQKARRHPAILTAGPRSERSASSSWRPEGRKVVAAARLAGPAPSGAPLLRTAGHLAHTTSAKPRRPAGSAAIGRGGH